MIYNTANYYFIIVVVVIIFMTLTTFRVDYKETTGKYV